MMKRSPGIRAADLKINWSKLEQRARGIQEGLLQAGNELKKMNKLREESQLCQDLGMNYLGR